MSSQEQQSHLAAPDGQRPRVQRAERVTSSAAGYEYNGYAIPARMAGGIDRYIRHGIMPGSFLTAVLENDLREAVGRADRENLANLPAYVSYFYNEVPGAAWGSPERVRAWSEARTAERTQAAEA